MNLRKYQEAVLAGSGHTADEPMNGSLLNKVGDALQEVAIWAARYGYSIEELASLNYENLHKQNPTLYPDVLA